LTGSRLAASRHGGLDVACPNVCVDSPFFSMRQIRDAVVGTGADPRAAFGIWRLSLRYTASAQERQRLSALELIKRADLKQSRINLYLYEGLYGRCGLYEGVERPA
jgi:hypothetical protein